MSPPPSRSPYFFPLFGTTSSLPVCQRCVLHTATAAVSSCTVAARLLVLVVFIKLMHAGALTLLRATAVCLSSLLRKPMPASPLSMHFTLATLVPRTGNAGGNWAAAKRNCAVGPHGSYAPSPMHPFLAVLTFWELSAPQPMLDRLDMWPASHAQRMCCFRLHSSTSRAVGAGAASPLSEPAWPALCGPCRSTGLCSLRQSICAAA